MLRTKLSEREISAVKSQIRITQRNCKSCRKHGYPDFGYPDLISESYLKEWLKWLPEAPQSVREVSKV